MVLTNTAGTATPVFSLAATRMDSRPLARFRKPGPKTYPDNIAGLKNRLSTKHGLHRKSKPERD
jgi:hypothetical protein